MMFLDNIPWRNYMGILIIVSWKDGRACAVVSDSPEIRGSGKSEEEAIGNLIVSHKAKLNVPIELRV